MQSTHDEKWLPIAGHEGHYEVSDRGRVRSLDWTNSRGILVPGRIRKLPTDSWGYQQVGLQENGKQVLHLVHKLVMEAFVGERPSPTHQICHNNGDQADNRLVNLRYDTPSANATDTVKHGTHPQVRVTVCKRGHLLQEPNLVPSALKNNRRSCLACRRESYRKYRTGEAFSDDRANENYRLIMSHRRTE